MCEEKDKGLIIENNDALSPREEEKIRDYFENVVGMHKGKLIVQPIEDE
ncbi:MAG: hypothetical protein ACQEP3_02705 [Patescibacteria group bacterium]